MSEHTSATWLMPTSSNCELRLCGLIIPGLPSRRHGAWLVPWRRSESEPNIRFRSIPEKRRSRDRGDPSHDEGGPSVSTVSDSPTSRARLPTNRGRQTQVAIDTAARTVIARKGILATTIADIATEAGRSTASFYNYYDSKEAMVREWALRFRDEVGERSKPVARHGLSDRERAQQAAPAHWHTYKHLLAEMISVSQLAIVNDDFAQHWADIRDIPTSFIAEMVRRAQADGYGAGDDPQ